MTREQLLMKVKEVLSPQGLEDRFLFVQVDKDTFTLVDGKTIDEITIDLEKKMLWLGSGCIIQYNRIGYKTDEQALELYGGLIEAWMKSLMTS